MTVTYGFAFERLPGPSSTCNIGRLGGAVHSAWARTIIRNNNYLISKKGTTAFLSVFSNNNAYCSTNYSDYEYIIGATNLIWMPYTDMKFNFIARGTNDANTGQTLKITATEVPERALANPISYGEYTREVSVTDNEAFQTYQTTIKAPVNKYRQCYIYIDAKQVEVQSCLGWVDDFTDF